MALPTARPQHTTDAIAQRKTRSGSKAKVRVDPNSGFDAIASTIKAKDKPLVVYVSEGCAVPEAPPGGVAPKIVLRCPPVRSKLIIILAACVGAPRRPSVITLRVQL